MEIAELVAELDKVSAEQGSAVTEPTARIAALDTQSAGDPECGGGGGSWSRPRQGRRRPSGKRQRMRSGSGRLAPG